MNLNPNEAQQRIRMLAREFAREHLAPQASELDVSERFPVDSFQKLGQAGLLGLNVPEAYGGAMAGTLALASALSEIAYVCASTAVGMSVTNMVGETICRFGTEEQKTRFVPGLVSGDSVAGAFCLSEPGSGSDAASLSTVAKRVGDDYVLTGTKMWITSGAHAGVFIVMARTGQKEQGPKAISAFLIEPDAEGFSVGPAEDKCGLRGSNTVPVILEDCVVPSANRLAEEGMGFRIAMTALDGGRITIGAMANGIARAALDASASYVAKRKQLSRSQAVQRELADMATGLEAAELLVQRGACLKERSLQTGERFTEKAAIAKLFATENAKDVTAKAVDLHGLDGYIGAYQVERFMRDARVTSIFEGTSEIQRLVIAREAFKHFA